MARTKKTNQQVTQPATMSQRDIMIDSGVKQILAAYAADGYDGKEFHAQCEFHRIFDAAVLLGQLKAHGMTNTLETLKAIMDDIAKAQEV